MHGEKETSMSPRAAGVILHAGIVAVAWWLYFGGGLEAVGDALGRAWSPGDAWRRGLLFSFGVVLWLRLTLGMFWILVRKFGWDELAGVLLACVVYQLGFALLGGAETAPLGAWDGCAAGLFLFGSYLNTASEIQRKRFKADSANQGRLYTQGWFRYARHINYFGDTLWAAGWAMLTRNPWSTLIPAALAAGFVFVFIPALTKHLQEKYGQQYNDWAATTKRYIPFIW